MSVYLLFFRGLPFLALSCISHGGHEFESMPPGEDKRLSVTLAQAAGREAQLIFQPGHIGDTHNLGSITKGINKARAEILQNLMVCSSQS